MQVPFHALRARGLGGLSCLCPILVLRKARFMHYSNSFFQTQECSCEQLCVHWGWEELKATKCRGSSSVEEVALETGICESIPQKLLFLPTLSDLECLPCLLGEWIGLLILSSWKFVFFTEAVRASLYVWYLAFTVSQLGEYLLTLMGLLIRVHVAKFSRQSIYTRFIHSSSILTKG